MALYIVHMLLQIGMRLDCAEESVVAHRNGKIKNVRDEVRWESYGNFVECFLHQSIMTNRSDLSVSLPILKLPR